MNQIVSRFMGSVQDRTHDDGRTIYRAKASGIKLDRYQSVVMPRGAVTEDFLNNPVMLAIHNFRERPVGRVLQLDIEDDEVFFDFVFSASEEGQEYERDYKNGDMNAFSISFIPLKWVWGHDLVNEKGEPLDVAELELADGSSRKLDLKQYAHRPRLIYTAWELLEISPVSVPAYPDALMVRSAALEALQARGMDDFSQPMVEDALDAALRDLAPALEQFVGEVSLEIKGAVPAHSTPNVDTAWDATTARAKVAKWASRDGSGEKEKLTWGKYAQAFAWFNSEEKKALSSYKLPHHTIDGEGRLVTVKRGVTSAMAALLSARGGVDVGEDRKAVYNHLVRHYRDLEMIPPEMENEYSDEELQAIDNGTWEPEQRAPESPPAEVPPTVEESSVEAPDLATMISTIFEGVKREIVEELSQHSIKIGMLYSLVEENGLAVPRTASTSTPNPAEEPEPVLTISKDLQGLLDKHAPLTEGATEGE